ncbi:YbjQ family protein [Aeromonas caviae]|uniref:YbjQ family protein n=1 Tax=Aeromonas caviae TaxID=648 RepID=UPI00191CD750|nr:YbjQ family protein [Aeromonas caviae]MBL0516240.1 YbjQ family protein [Aeromonas caviae]MDX7690250.1 YbjQ family protein [Aeromonas caviae]MDX7782986.1 YbjQ family protein [Aeromonas caviae]MDX7786037.1 YbjQ family protein [Aeromonas caviae]
MSSLLLLSTTNDIPGYKVTEFKGLVKGIVVRSPTMSQGFSAGLKSIVGGEIGALIEVCEQTRETAQKKMELCAIELDANAVIGMRFDTAEVYNFSEVLCYGTAVRVEKA